MSSDATSGAGRAAHAMIHLVPDLLGFLSFGGGFTARVVSAGRSKAGRRVARTHGPDGFVEYRLETLLCQSGTLEILHGADVLRHGHALRVLDGRHASVFPLSGCVFETSYKTLTGRGASR